VHTRWTACDAQRGPNTIQFSRVAGQEGRVGRRRIHVQYNADMLAGGSWAEV